VKNPGLSARNGRFLQGEIIMRLVCPEQRLDCLPISEVTLNLNCRDEIIPILRGLQHLYGTAPLRRELLTLVGKDVNQSTSRKRGRRGMNYWEIAVLASVRLGCVKRQLFFPISDNQNSRSPSRLGTGQRQLLFPVRTTVGLVGMNRFRLRSPRRVKRRRALRGRNPTKG
jgi:hypothetical protein